MKSGNVIPVLGMLNHISIARSTCFTSGRYFDGYEPLQLPVAEGELLLLLCLVLVWNMTPL